MINRSLLASFLIAAAACGPAVAQAPARAQAQPAKASADDAYVLGPDDVVELEVLGRSDFKVRAKIASDGTIQLPFIGTTDAANRTARQLADEVGAALEKGGYFAKPIMRADVVSYASRYVTVLGAVATPGLVPIDRKYRLSEVLARVGGTRPDAADYVILRPEGREEQRLQINALAVGGPESDPYVAAGDKIYLPKSDVFYVSGEVRQPGSYPMVSDMTLAMALAKGGGVTDAGTTKGIEVTRANGQTVRLPLSARILPGDVIRVRQRLF